MSWREWIRTVEVEPSLYAADFANLGEQIDVLLRTGARVFHFDVGDGHFVEPITVGPIVLQAIAPIIHAVSAPSIFGVCANAGEAESIAPAMTEANARRQDARVMIKSPSLKFPRLTRVR